MKTRANRWTIIVLTCLAIVLASGSAFAGDNGRKTGHAKRAGDPAREGSRPDQDGVGMDRGIVNEDKVGPGADWNNGCGNDADREDDNNGWCGRKPDQGVAAQRTFAAERMIVAMDRAETSSSVGASRTLAVGSALVPGSAAVRAVAPAAGSERPAGAGVQATVLSRVGDLLASTGVRLLMLGALAALLMSAGVMLLRRRPLRLR